MEKAIAVLKKFIVDFDDAHEKNKNPGYTRAAYRSVKEIEYRDRCLGSIDFCLNILLEHVEIEDRKRESAQYEQRIMQSLGAEEANAFRKERGLSCGFPEALEIPISPSFDPLA